MTMIDTSGVTENPDPPQESGSSGSQEPRSVTDSIESALDAFFSDDEGKSSATSGRDDKGRFAAQTEPAPDDGIVDDPNAEKVADDPSAQTDVTESGVQADTNPAEAPARLSNEAKAGWAQTPPAVQAEIHRAFREMEGGIAKYRDQATRYEQEILPYEQLAQHYGLGGVKDVLADYEGMARMMATDPLAVFDTLATRHGFTLQQIASHVMGQELDDYVQQTNQKLLQLQNENAELKRATSSFTEQQKNQTRTMVHEFAAKHPRFYELEGTIAGFLKSGLVQGSDPMKALQEAYEMADRLKPGPATATAPAPARPADQTRGKGQLSVTGAPGTGSNPDTRKTPASARDAVDNAFNILGI